MYQWNIVFQHDYVQMLSTKKKERKPLDVRVSLNKI